MAHLKQALSSFCTLFIAFFNFNFSGRGTYEDPFNGLFILRTQVLVPTLPTKPLTLVEVQIWVKPCNRHFKVDSFPKLAV
jgi:hypothetical protein